MPGDIIGSGMNIITGGTDEKTATDNRTISCTGKSPANFFGLAEDRRIIIGFPLLTYPVWDSMAYLFLAAIVLFSRICFFWFKVASLLLDTLSNWAKSVELEELYLGTTYKLLAAHRGYEKNRFKEVFKKALPRGFPVMSVDTQGLQIQVLNGPAVSFEGAENTIF